MQQQNLINVADFKGAYEMDVTNIKSLFGTKYDAAIAQTRQYYIKSGLFK